MEKSVEFEIADYIREVLEMKEVEPEGYSPLTLAYIGDSIYDLIIKTKVISEGNKQVKKLHQETSSMVQASAQSEMMRVLQPLLTEEEHAVYRRGRNAKSVSPAKNQSLTDYRRATGFEALMGWLYLKREWKRMADLVKIGLDHLSECEEEKKQEKHDFFKFYADYTAGRTKLYAGTGSLNFEDTVALSNEVNEMGYEGAMVIGPCYYALDQEKIFVYYDTLAKAVKGNLYIYNFPARSGHSIAPETLKKLVENNANIKGLKDSVSEPNHTNELMLAVEGHEFEMFSGFDDQFLYNLTSGGVGCIGALSNIVPEIWSDLVKSTKEKDFDRVMALSELTHELMPLYDLDSNFSLLFKKLMQHRGVEIEDRAIFPYNQMEESVYKKAEILLDKVIKKYQKLK